MKVRVPKELRPPERFKPFRDPDPIHSFGRFQVVGLFRRPRAGEYYWRPNSDAGITPHTAQGGVVMRAISDKTVPRVILECVE